MHVNCKTANLLKQKVYQDFVFKKTIYHLQFKRNVAKVINSHTRNKLFMEVWDVMQWIKRKTFQLAAACLPCEFKACLVRDFPRNIMFLLSPHWDIDVSMLCPYVLHFTQVLMSKLTW